MSQLAQENVPVDDVAPVVKSAHDRVELCVSTACMECHVSVNLLICAGVIAIMLKSSGKTDVKINTCTPKQSGSCLHKPKW